MLTGHKQPHIQFKNALSVNWVCFETDVARGQAGCGWGPLRSRYCSLNPPTERYCSQVQLQDGNAVDKQETVFTLR